MPIDSQPAPSVVESSPVFVAPTPPASVVPDPNNPRWGLAEALVVLVGSILLQFAFSILLLVPFALMHGMNPASAEKGRDFVQFATSDPTAILLQVLALLPAHLLSFALVWMVVTRFGKAPFRASLGWSWTNRLELGASVGLGVILFVIASVIAWLLGTDKPTQLEQIINSSTAARYAIAGLAVFTAPLVEELIYRGVLYAALQRLVGVVGAVIIVLVVFTVIHVPQYWPNFGVIAAVGLLSVVLTLIRAYTGRLLPCIVVHLVFNAIQSVLLLIEPYLPRLTPAADPTAGFVLTIVHLVSPIL